MKKAIVVVLIAVLAILVLSLAGCGPAKEKLASESLKLTLNNYIAGDFSDDDIAAMTQGFSAMGLSDQATQDLVDTVKNLLSKLTFNIVSSTADANDPNLFVVNTDIVTVDGAAIFTDDAAIEASVRASTEESLTGADEATATTAGLDALFSGILEKSKTAEATVNANMDFKMTYDSSTNTFTFVEDEGEWSKLLGMNNMDFESVYQQKSEQKLADLTASGAFSASILNLMVQTLQPELDSMSSTLTGIFTISAEARGDNTLVVIFKAEASQYESKDIVQAATTGLDASYSTLPGILQSSGVLNPVVRVEFLKMNGDLIYSKEYTVQ